MTELERTLSRLGEELDWPPTPDLASSLRARLSAPPARRPGLLPAAGLRSSLALALVALLLLAGTALAALPGVRDAVLELFGLQGAAVERRATLPTPPPERPLDLGTHATLAGARASLGFEPLLPAELGPPDGVYVRRGVPGAELSLTYRSRPGMPRAGTTRVGLLVTEFRGDLAPEYLGKVVGLSATVERPRIDGGRALWIEGAPHFFLYRDPDGNVAESQMRLAQDVLLLERDRLLVRLEGAFGRDRAIALARSLR